MKRGVLSLLTVLLAMPLFLPLVSAVSPSDLFENEWTVPALIFLGMFSMIFVALGRTSMFKKEDSERLPRAIISFVVAAIATWGVNEQLLYGRGFGGELADMITFAIIAIFLIFLAIFTWKSVGLFGLTLIVGVIWLVLFNWDFYYAIPSSIPPIWADTIFNIAKWWVTGVIIIVIAILSLVLDSKRTSKGGITISPGSS